MGNPTPREKMIGKRGVDWAFKGGSYQVSRLAKWRTLSDTASFQLFPLMISNN